MLGRCPSRPNTALGSHDFDSSTLPQQLVSLVSRVRRLKFLKVEVSVTVASVVAELPGDWLENVCTREFNKVSFPLLAHARMCKKIQTKLSHRVTTWLVTQPALRQFGELSYRTLSGS